MKEALCIRCGDSVVFEDYGDNPSFLSGKCEGCGLKGDYTEGRGYAWDDESGWVKLDKSLTA